MSMWKAGLAVLIALAGLFAGCAVPVDQAARPDTCSYSISPDFSPEQKAMIEAVIQDWMVATKNAPVPFRPFEVAEGADIRIVPGGGQVWVENGEEHVRRGATDWNSKAVHAIVSLDVEQYDWKPTFPAVTRHELGHALGLPHDDEGPCLMTTLMGEQEITGRDVAQYEAKWVRDANR